MGCALLNLEWALGCQLCNAPVSVRRAADTSRATPLWATQADDCRYRSPGHRRLRPALWEDALQVIPMLLPGQHYSRRGRAGSIHPRRRFGALVLWLSGFLAWRLQ